MAEMSFLKLLRDTASKCPNLLTAKMLRDSADEIAERAKTLATSPTVEALAALNGAWAKATRTLSLAEQAGDPNRGGGAMPVPERMAA